METIETEEQFWNELIGELRKLNGFLEKQTRRDVDDDDDAAPSVEAPIALGDGEGQKEGGNGKS